MKSRNSNKQSGMTLVEVLATTVLVSIVLIFISSLLIFIQKQFSTQKTDIKQLHDVTYVSQVVLKDIRKSDKRPVKTGNRVEIGENIYIHDRENNTVRRNNTMISDEIVTFNIEMERETNAVHLLLISTSKQTVETTIMLRGDNDDEEIET
ncbi:MAG TPA: type II secretion system protein [Cerasibacillus sp.]|uniref:PilW family protein n=1 Tax=Cerasibacillus sp. TaxID=2498711 RepID=UPI002F413B73